MRLSRRSATLLLAFVALTPSALPQSPQPTFETATVRTAPPSAKPGEGSWSPPNTARFTAHHLTLTVLLQLAYGIDASQIANQPGWLETNLYDIDAKPEDGIRLTREELKPRLQNLLRERFHLVAHIETRKVRGYALVVAKGGPTLTPAKGDRFPGYRIDVSRGQMQGANWTTAYLARMLAPAAGFPVTDETGLTGSYDIHFSFEANPETDSGLPSLAAALKQATGLELKSKMIPVETIVIDSIDPVPTAN